MSEILRGPAYRIETERLVVRCWQPSDAALLKVAVDASLEELRPFLPWAFDEPQPIDAKVELLRSFRGRFDLGQDFVYGIFDREEEEVVGGTGLHTRVGDGAREIGYWIATKHAGRGFATESAAALVRVGFEVDRLARVEIHCDPSNERSLAIPRKLGFRHEGTLRARIPRRRGGPADRMIWTVLDAEYRDTPCARAALRAFDAAGRIVLEGAAEPRSATRSAFR